MKRGDYERAVRLFQQEADVFTQMGAFHNISRPSSQRLGLDYAGCLTKLGAVQARTGKIYAALDSWSLANHIYSLYGLCRSAVTAKPHTLSKECQVGMTITQANRLLFEMPQSKENTLGEQIMIYSDTAKQRIPFLLPIFGANLVKIQNYYSEKQYPWEDYVVIDRVQVIKNFRKSAEIGSVRVPSSEFERVKKGTQKSANPFLVNSFYAFRDALEPERNYNVKTLSELEKVYGRDDQIQHDIRKEMQRYLETRWSATRIEEFCQPETKYLGLRGYPLHSDELPLTSISLSNDKFTTRGTTAWFSEMREWFVDPDKTKVRPTGYFVRRVLNGQEWLLDYGFCSTKQWTGDDYLIHTVEAILLNSLDNQRLHSSKDKGFDVVTEADLNEPIIYRSIALVKNRQAKICHDVNGTITGYSCVLPDSKKLEVQLDAKQNITTILLDGKEDLVWLNALKIL